MQRKELEPVSHLNALITKEGQNHPREHQFQLSMPETSQRSFSVGAGTLDGVSFPNS